MFIGMAAGSALGSIVLSSAGWRGVSVFAAGAAFMALAVRFWPAKRAR
jgi:predicted MFS family arabinose efflux permease